MTRRYLYPQTRRIEVTTALFAGGFGLYALHAQITTGIAVLGWTGWTEAERQTVVWGLVLASLAHGAGIRANGRWGWVSPALRALAMAAFAAFFAKLVIVGGGTTAAYTYAWITVGTGVGALNATQDLRRAWSGDGGHNWKFHSRRTRRSG